MKCGDVKVRVKWYDYEMGDCEGACPTGEMI